MLIGVILQEVLPLVNLSEKMLREGRILFRDPIIEKQKELLRYQTDPPFKRSVKFISSEFANKLHHTGEFPGHVTDFELIHVPQNVTKHLNKLLNQLAVFAVCVQPLHHSLC